MTGAVVLFEGVGLNGPDTYRRRRDHALIALYCYFGLRPEEIARLRECQVAVDARLHGVTIAVRRGGLLRLPVPPASAVPLLTLRYEAEAGHCKPTDCIFPRGERATTPRTSRVVRRIVQQARAQAGFPSATAADLGAAVADWLRLRAHSDHTAAAVLGLK